MVRASSKILHIHIESLHYSFNPIVQINYSTPALNMHSRKRAVLKHVHVDFAQIVSETDNILHHFALPNNLDDNTVVQLLQNDTTYQPQYVGDKLVNTWKETKERERVEKKGREIGQVEESVEESVAAIP